MDISQSALALLYLYSLILGVGAGLLYDGLRITRVFLGVHYSRRTAKRLHELPLPLLRPAKERKRSPLLGAVVFLEDFLFCVTCAVFLILLFYQVNNGKIRLPAIFCAVGGFFVYRATIGKGILPLLEWIAFFFMTGIRYVFFFVSFPLRWSARKCAGTGRTLIRWIRAQRCASLCKKNTAEEEKKISVDGCGLLPERIGRTTKVRRGIRVDKNKAETVQSEFVDANFSRDHRPRINRGVRKQHHALQRADGRKKGT